MAETAEIAAIIALLFVRKALYEILEALVLRSLFNYCFTVFAVFLALVVPPCEDLSYSK